MEYQLRVLDATAYGRVVGVLRSTEGSEVVKLAARCVEVLQAESFARYNSEERRRDWLDLCRAVDARAPVPPIEPFAEVTVALLAMPCFQYSYYERGMATPLSPNLVYLGDDDGGCSGSCGTIRGSIRSSFVGSSLGLLSTVFGDTWLFLAVKRLGGSTGLRNRSCAVLGCFRTFETMRGASKRQVGWQT